jgi:hypothetical protein
MVETAPPCGLFPQAAPPRVARQLPSWSSLGLRLVPGDESDGALAAGTGAATGAAGTGAAAAAATTTTAAAATTTAAAAAAAKASATAAAASGGGTEQPFLLLGPAQSGKTSLLFQLAYNRAAALPDARVLLVCDRAKMAHAHPRSWFEDEAGGEEEPGARPCERSAAVLRRIDLKYVKGREELFVFLANLGTLGTWHTLLVDDLDLLCEATPQLAAGPALQRARPPRAVQAHAMCLLRDAARGLTIAKGLEVLFAAALTTPPHAHAEHAARDALDRFRLAGLALVLELCPQRHRGPHVWAVLAHRAGAAPSHLDACLPAKGGLCGSDAPVATTSLGAFASGPHGLAVLR